MGAVLDNLSRLILAGWVVHEKIARAQQRRHLRGCCR
jgi:hypothetical protein